MSKLGLCQTFSHRTADNDVDSCGHNHWYLKKKNTHIAHKIARYAVRKVIYTA